MPSSKRPRFGQYFQHQRQADDDECNSKKLKKKKKNKGDINCHDAAESGEKNDSSTLTSTTTTTTLLSLSCFSSSKRSLSSSQRRRSSSWSSTSDEKKNQEEGSCIRNSNNDIIVIDDKDGDYNNSDDHHHQQAPDPPEQKGDHEEEDIVIVGMGSSCSAAASSSPQERGSQEDDAATATGTATTGTLCEHDDKDSAERMRDLPLVQERAEKQEQHSLILPMNEQHDGTEQGQGSTAPGVTIGDARNDVAGVGAENRPLQSEVSIDSSTTMMPTTTNTTSTNARSTNPFAMFACGGSGSGGNNQKSSSTSSSIKKQRSSLLHWISNNSTALPSSSSGGRALGPPGSNNNKTKKDGGNVVDNVNAVVGTKQQEKHLKTHSKGRNSAGKKPRTLGSSAGKKQWVKMRDLSIEERDKVIAKWHSMLQDHDRHGEKDDVGQHENVDNSNDDRHINIHDGYIELRRYQLLIAARLHARCQDAAVRKVMYKLLTETHYLSSIDALAGTKEEKDEHDHNAKAVAADTDGADDDNTHHEDNVRSYLTTLQYYNMKTKHIIQLSKEISSTRYDGIVPEDENQLMQLTGIGPVMADLLSVINTKEMHHQRIVDTSKYKK